MCAGRAGSLFRPRFPERGGRGAGGDRPQWLRKDLVAAADRGPAAPCRRVDRACRRQCRADAARAGALSRPPRCVEAGTLGNGKSFLLEGFFGRRAGRCREKPRPRRPRPRCPSAGRLPLRRPAPPPVDRTAVVGEAADLAPGRADHRARCSRPRDVCRTDARTSRCRRADHRGDPCTARDRREGIADRRHGMTALSALIRRDIRIALRVGGGALIGVLFSLTVVVLMPFAIGPDLPLLKRLGPAILWLGALLASLLTLDRLFTADHEDGSLDLIVMSRTPLELACAAKALAHWLAAGLPLIIATPVLGLLLNLDGTATLAVAATLLAGTPALTFTGMIGAALAVTLRRGGLLLAVLVLPLSIPVWVFGVAASQAAITGPMSFGTPFSILCALSLVSFVIGPFAAAASLRHGLD